jgi:Domain of Unknown Function (DUF1259)
MRVNLWKFVAMTIVGLIVLGASPTGAFAADPDWKAVEQALGKSGQLQAGDVFRIGMPRTDLSVTVKGVPVKAGFALGSRPGSAGSDGRSLPWRTRGDRSAQPPE